jgi:hypothetical protein
MEKAMASGKATRPTVMPGDQVVQKFVGVVVAQTEDRLRKPTFVKENTPIFLLCSKQAKKKENCTKGRTHQGT